MLGLSVIAAEPLAMTNLIGHVHLGGRSYCVGLMSAEDERLTPCRGSQVASGQVNSTCTLPSCYYW